jgi:acyl-CoA thioesterase-1
MHAPVDVPGLPRVLLIGDSISIAYTLPVRELLAGKANVHRIPVNGTHSKTGRSALTRWLGDSKWDVVHFNFGLHDAKLVASTGEPAVSREAYVDNLKTIAQQLKATGAKVIFATTTPIPQALMAPTLMPGPLPAKARLFDNIPERNALAAQALKEADITIVDLYSVILPSQEKLQRKNDVHFTPEGSQVLAQAVADGILAQLPSKP